MGTTRIISSTLAISAALLLLGCAAPQTATEQQLPAAAVDPTAEQMCWQYSDAQTLLLNMSMANDEGRLVGNEWDGIVRLTMRMIDDIPVDDATEVGRVLAALQTDIPDGRSGQMVQPYDFDSLRDAGDPVKAACTAVIPEWGVEGWVGG